MPLAWRTWRYLQIDVETADQPITIQQLARLVHGVSIHRTGAFPVRRSVSARIWEVGWRTARLDAHDTYMDTPYWERLQYVGDTRIQALISYTVAGDDRLARQAIDAYNYSRIPEGLTQSRYPSSLTQIIPTFSLLWVGMVHDFWMYRGMPISCARNCRGRALSSIGTCIGRGQTDCSGKFRGGRLLTGERFRFRNAAAGRRRRFVDHHNAVDRSSCVMLRNGNASGDPHYAARTVRPPSRAAKAVLEPAGTGNMVCWLTLPRRNTSASTQTFWECGWT